MGENGSVEMYANSIQGLSLGLVDGHTEGDPDRKLMATECKWQARRWGRTNRDTWYKNSFTRMNARQYLGLDDAFCKGRDDESGAITQPRNGFHVT